MNIFSIQNKGYKTMKESAYEELSRVSKTIDEFRKMPIYYSGDDTFVTNEKNATYSDFVLLRNENSTYLQNGSFFQFAGIPILWIGMVWELVSNKAFIFSWIDLLPLTALQR